MSTLTRPAKVATDSPVRRSSPRRTGSRGAYKGLLFTLPFLLGFLATYVVPIGYAFSQSLHEKKSTGLGFGPTRVVYTGFAASIISWYSAARRMSATSPLSMAESPGCPSWPGWWRYTHAGFRSRNGSPGRSPTR